MKKIERIGELVTILNNASNKYYNGQESDITDKQWDLYFDELKQLELETNNILSNSPTQNVGYEVISKLEKVKHSTLMLSLDKTKSVNDLTKFLSNKEGILSWKEDGLTVVLTYDNYKLTDAVTRGNGEIGSRILSNAKVFKAGIPLVISFRGHLVIRGESLISKQDFDIINIGGDYANPRNLTSGSVMALDNRIAKRRQLQFKAFSIAECGKEFKSYSEQLDWLEEIGFNPVEYQRVTSNDLSDNILLAKEKISDYSFMTDGLVLKYNDLKYGNSLGSTSHHRLDSLAFKWKDTIEETTLRSIQFQVGRTGVLTPVANFDEVELEGSIVSKASLHNVSILKALELGIGDIVSVYKANMIIPQINSNLTRSNTFMIPTICPECGGALEIKQTNSAEFLMCVNPNCSSKKVAIFEHFVSRNAMNILGLGEAIIETFINKGLMSDLVDIYKLEEHKKEIVHMEGFGITSYNKLIQSINNTKETELYRFIYGIGIPQVGLSTAKDLCKYFGNDIDYIMNAEVKDFLTIKDIGDIVANNLYNWFKEQSNIDMLMELFKYITFEQEQEVETTEGIFTGKKIYCTGSFASHKKNELKDIVTSLGGEFANGYAKSLDYLVVGSLKGSTKTQKAEKDGVPVLTEEEFLEMIK
jgi:DNA ligase (NAD+)